mmetsp:Transcript_63182/g.73953  ORF Transcript_63182/g.73953 Transcript_63182/m.73953 type:complete len:213 (-) Transcript_63182:970-1608(-)
MAAQFIAMRRREVIRVAVVSISHLTTTPLPTKRTALTRHVVFGQGLGYHRLAHMAINAYQHVRLFVIGQQTALCGTTRIRMFILWMRSGTTSNFNRHHFVLFVIRQIHVGSILSSCQSNLDVIFFHHRDFGSFFRNVIEFVVVDGTFPTSCEQSTQKGKRTCYIAVLLLLLYSLVLVLVLIKLLLLFLVIGVPIPCHALPILLSSTSHQNRD